jgi:regulator of sigma E protease
MRMEGITIKKPLWENIASKGRKLLVWTGIIKQAEAKPFLQSGDVILSISNTICPTYQDFREVVKEHGGKELPIKVLRKDANGIEKAHTISVIPTPHKDFNEVAIGISFFKMYDTQHAVIAKTIDTKGGPAKLDIPRGATITAVGGVRVSNFYDIIREIRRHHSERITIDWRLDAETAGHTALNVDDSEDWITLKPTFSELVPLEDLKRVYKATGPIEAVVMGYRKTVMFITQTYITIKRLIAGLVSPKNLMGPVGIITLSYRVVAAQPIIYYVYLLGLISAAIAVFNFLPVPPLDGGLIVLLLIEKIKGSALSEKTQEVIAYTGWVFIGGFALYITFNDIVRIFS